MLHILFCSIRFIQFLSRSQSALSLICLMCMLFFRSTSRSYSSQFFRDWVLGRVFTSDREPARVFSRRIEQDFLRISLLDLRGQQWMREALGVVFSNSKTWKELPFYRLVWRVGFLRETTLSLKEVLGVCLMSDSAEVRTELALRELFLLKASASILSRASLWSPLATQSLDGSSMSMFCMEMREQVYSRELSRGMRVPLLLVKEGMRFQVNLKDISSEEGKLACGSHILIQKLQKGFCPGLIGQHIGRIYDGREGGNHGANVYRLYIVGERSALWCWMKKLKVCSTILSMISYYY